MAAPGGEPVHIAHPSLILFFRADCEPCKYAAAALARFTGEPVVDRGVPILAITIDRLPASTTASNQREEGVVVMRLEAGVPQLAFVNQVPMFVRTDSLGDVTQAFVGIPSMSVLDQMR